MKTVNQRMRRANEFNNEWTDSHHVARLNPMQQHVSQDAMLIKLALRQSQREVRRVDRHIESLQNVRQRAQMIFMTVREYHRRNLFAVLFENFEVRNANIDAIDALFRKAHARVDDNHLVAKAQQRAIHPKLANAAEGNDFEDLRH